MPNLGLTDDEFHGLAATTDAVYHCGALVNFLYPYSYLKDTNVLGTQEIIRLATNRTAPWSNACWTTSAKCCSASRKPFAWP